MDDERLIARYIDATGTLPEDARVAGTAITVWELIRDLLAAQGDVLQVAAANDLPGDAVLAGRAYYFRYAAAIDARIGSQKRRSQGRNEA